MFLDLSGGLAPTTAGIKMGSNTIVGTTMKNYEPAANTWDMTAIANTFSLLRIIPNISTVSTTALRGAMRVMNTSSGGNPEYLALEAQGTNGYFINATKAGGGTARPLTIEVSTHQLSHVHLQPH